MKFKQIISGTLLAAVVSAPIASYAGNPDRSGSAGAQELLINPYALPGGAFSFTACLRGPLRVRAFVRVR